MQREVLVGPSIIPAVRIHFVSVVSSAETRPGRSVGSPRPLYFRRHPKPSGVGDPIPDLSFRRAPRASFMGFATSGRAWSWRGWPQIKLHDIGRTGRECALAIRRVEVPQAHEALVPALHAHRRQGVKEGQEPWSEGACVIGPEGKAGLEAQPARFAWRGKTQRYPWMPGRGAGIDRRRRGTRRRGNR